MNIREIKEVGRALAEIQYTALKEAKRDGWDEAVRAMAIMNNGKLFVGHLSQPLFEVLNANPYLESSDRYILCFVSGCSSWSGRRANESGCDFCPEHQK